MKHKADLILFALSIIALATGIISYVRKKPPEPILELVFTQWWQNEMEPGILENLIIEFEENNENVKIILKTLDYEETRKLLYGYFPDYNDPDSGEIIKAMFPGDILAFDYLWLEDLYNNGVLDPGSSPLEPLIGFFYPFFYNINVLLEAGFSRPPKTRTELLNYIRVVTGENKNRYGIGFSLDENNSRGIFENIYPWFWGSSVSLLESGRPFNETFDFLTRLANENLIHPQSFFMDENEKHEAFINGQIAFMTASIRDIEYLKRRMGEDAFSISDIPRADNYLGKPYFAASDWSLGIFEGSAHKELAAGFISFITEKKNLLAESANALTSDFSFLLPVFDDPVNFKARELYIAGDLVNEKFLPRNIEQNAAERDFIFREELFDLLEGKQSAAETAANVRQRWGN